MTKYTFTFCLWFPAERAGVKAHAVYVGRVWKIRLFWWGARGHKITWWHARSSAEAALTINSSAIVRGLGAAGGRTGGWAGAAFSDAHTMGHDAERESARAPLMKLCQIWERPLTQKAAWELWAGADFGTSQDGICAHKFRNMTLWGEPFWFAPAEASARRIYVLPI